jgi:hypothetical protein
LHGQLDPPLEPEPPVEPKPPRWLCVAAGAVLLGVGDVVVVAVLLPVLVLVAALLPGDGVLVRAGPRKNGLGNSQRYGNAPKPAPTPGAQE